MSASINPTLTLSEIKARAWTFCPLLIRHLKTQGVAWALAWVVYVLLHANYRLAVNQTQSLPYKLFLIELNAHVETGGFVAFRTRHIKPYPDHEIFVKRALATAGDTVVRHGRDFTVGDRTLVGKEIGLSKTRLYPNDELVDGANVVPPKKYFVGGDHEYSLDSRYKLLGLVNERDVIGRAYPIF